MRLLVVEDDPTISSFLVKGLQEAGYAVDAAADGLRGLELALTEPSAAAVLDLMLPGRDGLSVLEELRRRRVNLPILILSAKHSVDDRVRGLQAGGDDYLTKPFAFSELLARIQAIVRRSQGATEPTRLVSGDITIDLVARQVERGGKRLDLRPREFALLEYLVRNAGRVVSKTMIMEHVWEYSFDPRTNVVAVLVFRLREKVDRDFEVKRIRTVRGIGYVLDVA